MTGKESERTVRGVNELFTTWAVSIAKKAGSRRPHALACKVLRMARMKTLVWSTAVLLLIASSAAACAQSDETEAEAANASKLEGDASDAFCTDDDPEGLPSDEAELDLGLGGSLALGTSDAGAGDGGTSVSTPVSTATAGTADGGARTARSGSLPAVTLDVGTIALPRQFIGRIVLDPTMTCSITAQVGYSATPVPTNQWSVTISATVTGTCYVAVDGQRYGIIHPTIHGDTTITVVLSGSANVTTGLDCATVNAFTPSVSVKLGGSITYTDPIVDVYGRCGRRRPILSNIATNQARQQAAQAAAQVQQLIDAQLGQWQTSANTWLATQVPQIAGLLCGGATPTTPVVTQPVTTTTPTMDAGIADGARL